MKKAALITGASSGIGRASALEFARNGYFVYLMGRNKENLTETASQCRHGASVLSCDLTDKNAVEKRLEEVFGNKIYKLEVLVNSAGIYKRAHHEDSSDELWEEQFQVNLLGSVRVTRLLWPYFKAQKQGSIVNISSTLGLNPVAGTAAYSAMKAAMINWTTTLAQEGGADQIRANCVCPGIVETPIHNLEKLDDDTKKFMHGLHPLGRMGTADEIAKSVYFLGSDQSAWTTGAVLAVDGGINIA